MRYIRGIYDELRRKNIDEVDNLLLLHPDLIKEELKKLEDKSPFYIVGDCEESSSVFIPNEIIKDGFYCEEMKYYIPRKVMIPIGGIDGRFCIRTYGTYVDQETGMTKEKGYYIADRSTGEVLVDCDRLKYLSRRVALVDDFYVTRNQILHHEGAASIYDNGCLALNVEREYNTVYFLYDSNGDFITASYDKVMPSSTATFDFEAEEISFPRNVELFEQAIIACLKDKKELQGCTVDNLVDMATYLQENGLEFVVNLDTLAVHRANYGRFFRRNGIDSKNGIQYVYKRSKSDN